MGIRKSVVSCFSRNIHVMMSLVIPLIISLVSVLTSCTPLACPPGSILWPQDSSCHKLFSQGPCPQDQILITSIHEGVSCAGFEDEDEEDIDALNEIKHSTEETDNTFWILPSSDKYSLPTKEADCLSQDKIFWPADGLCHNLLDQGPCPTGHWLVLRNTTEDVMVTCAPRACPCDPSQPQLCEVELQPNTSACHCMVSLAAAQDGLCQVGEQLLVNPFGYGECGCISQPPHLAWPDDGLCYPVLSRGPCEPGYVLSLDTQGPSCMPQLCPEEGQVSYLGSCHSLGSRGPCAELETLELELDTLEPACVLDTSKVRRVFSAIPSVRGLVRQGPLDKRLQVRRRVPGVSRGRKVTTYVRRQSPRKYMSWLKN